MKKFLNLAILCVFGLSLQAQNLYVHLIDGSAPTVFSLAHKPTMTFGEGSKKIETATANQTFQLNTVRSISFKAPTSNIAVAMENEKFQLFPNPVKDELTLTTDISVNGLRFRIFDMNGKQQKTGRITAQETKIDMQNFRTGVYMFHIDRNGHVILSYKIVKQ
jgi:hypothetical protein